MQEGSHNGGEDTGICFYDLGVVCGFFLLARSPSDVFCSISYSERGGDAVGMAEEESKSPWFGLLRSAATGETFLSRDWGRVRIRQFLCRLCLVISELGVDCEQGWGIEVTEVVVLRADSPGRIERALEGAS